MVAADQGCDGVWASIYTSDQGATAGALFCTFNVDGQANIARCYFRGVDGNTPDRFTVTNFLLSQREHQNARQRGSHAELDGWS